ncbi:hypothetical protein [Palaeococcus sp. (in: euryarchaeotes)]
MASPKYLFSEKEKSRYKTIPLTKRTYALLKQEKLRYQENFGRKISWDELIELLLDFKRVVVNDE